MRPVLHQQQQILYGKQLGEMYERYCGSCPRRHRIMVLYIFAENMKTDPMIYSKGYLGLDRYNSEQSKTEQRAGCILLRIAVWLMDPSLRSL